MDLVTLIDPMRVPSEDDASVRCVASPVRTGKGCDSTPYNREGDTKLVVARWNKPTDACK